MSTGKRGLLEWINQTAQADYACLEDLADGVGYYHIIDAISPEHSKLDALCFNPRSDQQIRRNLQLLESAMRACGICDTIDIDRLMGRALAAHIDVTRALKNYAKPHAGRLVGYPALKRRGDAIKKQRERKRLRKKSIVGDGEDHRSHVDEVKVSNNLIPSHRADLGGVTEKLDEIQQQLRQPLTSSSVHTGSHHSGEYYEGHSGRAMDGSLGIRSSGMAPSSHTAYDSEASTSASGIISHTTRQQHTDLIISHSMTLLKELEDDVSKDLVAVTKTYSTLSGLSKQRRAYARRLRMLENFFSKTRYCVIKHMKDLHAIFDVYPSNLRMQFRHEIWTYFLFFIIGFQLLVILLVDVFYISCSNAILDWIISFLSFKFIWMSSVVDTVGYLIVFVLTAITVIYTIIQQPFYNHFSNIVTVFLFSMFSLCSFCQALVHLDKSYIPLTVSSKMPTAKITSLFLYELDVADSLVRLNSHTFYSILITSFVGFQMLFAYMYFHRVVKIRMNTHEIMLKCICLVCGLNEGDVSKWNGVVTSHDIIQAQETVLEKEIDEMDQDYELHEEYLTNFKSLSRFQKKRYSRFMRKVYNGTTTTKGPLPFPFFTKDDIVECMEWMKKRSSVLSKFKKLEEFEESYSHTRTDYSRYHPFSSIPYSKDGVMHSLFSECCDTPTTSTSSTISRSTTSRGNNTSESGGVSDIPGIDDRYSTLGVIKPELGQPSPPSPTSPHPRSEPDVGTIGSQFPILDPELSEPPRTLFPLLCYFPLLFFFSLDFDAIPRSLFLSLIHTHGSLILSFSDSTTRLMIIYMLVSEISLREQLHKRGIDGQKETEQTRINNLMKNSKYNFYSSRYKVDADRKILNSRNKPVQPVLTSTGLIPRHAHLFDDITPHSDHLVVSHTRPSFYFLDIKSLFPIHFSSELPRLNLNPMTPAFFSFLFLDLFAVVHERFTFNRKHSPSGMLVLCRLVVRAFTFPRSLSHSLLNSIRGVSSFDREKILSLYLGICKIRNLEIKGVSVTPLRVMMRSTLQEFLAAYQIVQSSQPMTRSYSEEEEVSEEEGHGVVKSHHKEADSRDISILSIFEKTQAQDPSHNPTQSHLIDHNPVSSLSSEVDKAGVVEERMITKDPLFKVKEIVDKERANLTLNSPGVCSMTANKEELMAHVRRLYPFLTSLYASLSFFTVTSTSETFSLKHFSSSCPPLAAISSPAAFSIIFLISLVSSLSSLNHAFHHSILSLSRIDDIAKSISFNAMCAYVRSILCECMRDRVKNEKRLYFLRLLKTLVDEMWGNQGLTHFISIHENRLIKDRGEHDRFSGQTNGIHRFDDSDATDTDTKDGMGKTQDSNGFTVLSDVNSELSSARMRKIGRTVPSDDPVSHTSSSSETTPSTTENADESPEFDHIDQSELCSSLFPASIRTLEQGYDISSALFQQEKLFMSISMWGFIGMAIFFLTLLITYFSHWVGQMKIASTMAFYEFTLMRLIPMVYSLPFAYSGAFHSTGICGSDVNNIFCNGSMLQHNFDGDELGSISSSVEETEYKFFPTPTNPLYIEDELYTLVHELSFHSNNLLSHLAEILDQVSGCEIHYTDKGEINTDKSAYSQNSIDKCILSPMYIDTIQLTIYNSSTVTSLGDYSFFDIHDILSNAVTRILSLAQIYDEQLLSVSSLNEQYELGVELATDLMNSDGFLTVSSNVQTLTEFVVRVHNVVKLFLEDNHSAQYVIFLVMMVVFVVVMFLAPMIGIYKLTTAHSGAIQLALCTTTLYALSTISKGTSHPPALTNSNTQVQDVEEASKSHGMNVNSSSMLIDNGHFARGFNESSALTHVTPTPGVYERKSSINGKEKSSLSSPFSNVINEKSKNEEKNFKGTTSHKHLMIAIIMLFLVGGFLQLVSFRDIKMLTSIPNNECNKMASTKYSILRYSHTSNMNLLNTLAYSMTSDLENLAKIKDEWGNLQLELFKESYDISHIWKSDYSYQLQEKIVFAAINVAESHFYEVFSVSDDHFRHYSFTENMLEGYIHDEDMRRPYTFDDIETYPLFSSWSFLLDDVMANIMVENNSQAMKYYRKASVDIASDENFLVIDTISFIFVILFASLILMLASIYYVVNHHHLFPHSPLLKKIDVVSVVSGAIGILWMITLIIISWIYGVYDVTHSRRILNRRDITVFSFTNAIEIATFNAARVIMMGVSTQSDTVLRGIQNAFNHIQYDMSIEGLVSDEDEIFFDSVLFSNAKTSSSKLYPSNPLFSSEEEIPFRPETINTRLTDYFDEYREVIESIYIEMRNIENDYMAENKPSMTSGDIPPDILTMEQKYNLLIAYFPDLLAKMKEMNRFVSDIHALLWNQAKNSSPEGLSRSKLRIICVFSIITNIFVTILLISRVSILIRLCNPLEDSMKDVPPGEQRIISRALKNSHGNSTLGVISAVCLIIITCSLSILGVLRFFGMSRLFSDSHVLYNINMLTQNMTIHGFERFLNISGNTKDKKKTLMILLEKMDQSLLKRNIFFLESSLLDIGIRQQLLTGNLNLSTCGMVQKLYNSDFGEFGNIANSISTDDYGIDGVHTAKTIVNTKKLDKMYDNFIYSKNNNNESKHDHNDIQDSIRNIKMSEIKSLFGPNRGDDELFGASSYLDENNYNIVSKLIQSEIKQHNLIVNSLISPPPDVSPRYGYSDIDISFNQYVTSVTEQYISNFQNSLGSVTIPLTDPALFDDSCFPCSHGLEIIEADVEAAFIPFTGDQCGLVAPFSMKIDDDNSGVNIGPVTLKLTSFLATVSRFCGVGEGTILSSSKLSSVEQKWEWKELFFPMWWMSSYVNQSILGEGGISARIIRVVTKEIFLLAGLNAASILVFIFLNREFFKQMLQRGSKCIDMLILRCLQMKEDIFFDPNGYAQVSILNVLVKHEKAQKGNLKNEKK
ncbi:Microtubule-associated protein RP/EB like protein [Aduncisulcus paluster]|uniref:Microtubule-associated protein RP/EB like protein n=1 Tax=Aduncisulcus paluster TaxID=2918883 RepID=A0ABQ5K946_9EUKA|nr:Microtubule-associated protein RP/EB like protein [Aduncisulcus paluster]